VTGISQTFKIMTPRNGREQKQKKARKRVTARLRDFFAELKALVDVDTDDFYRRVLEQAQAGRERDPSHA
jgi:hypothetical protein